MLYIFGILLLSYISLFLYSLKIKDNSIADVFWGAGFLILALGYFIYLGNYSIYTIISLGIIFAWGIRIIYQIGGKKLKKSGEDWRYAQWRKDWKYFKTRSFFQVYIFQGVLLSIISIPIYYIFSGNINIYLFILGIIIALFGLIYESVADIQINKYISGSPKKNHIFTGGLYKYSRHPNYFGEVMFWLGITLISFSNSWIGIIGFLVITGLLLFVSGVPMKEKRYKKKENYKEYKENTPLFLPNPFK